MTESFDWSRSNHPSEFYFAQGEYMNVKKIGKKKNNNDNNNNSNNITPYGSPNRWTQVYFLHLIKCNCKNKGYYCLLTLCSLCPKVQIWLHGVIT